MEKPTRQRKPGWVWAGLALLLLTGTIAISLLIHLIKNPGDVQPFIIVLILFFLGVPAVTIAYGVRGVRVKPVAEKQRIVKSIYSMRNGLGRFNIYTQMWWTFLISLMMLVVTIGLIWLVIIPLGWKIWSWAIPLVIAVFGGITFITFSLVRDCVKDIRVGCTKLVGSVSGKWAEKKSASTPYGGTVWTEYSIYIKGVSFQVSKKIYDWLLEGDEVCVSYWPHTKKVSRVDRVAGGALVTAK